MMTPNPVSDGLMTPSSHLGPSRRHSERANLWKLGRQSTSCQNACWWVEGCCFCEENKEQQTRKIEQNKKLSKTSSLTHNPHRSKGPPFRATSPTGLPKVVPSSVRSRFQGFTCLEDAVKAMQAPAKRCESAKENKLGSQMPRFLSTGHGHEVATERNRFA